MNDFLGNVIYHQGRYQEFSCGVVGCGANTNGQNGTRFGGFKGLQAHFRQVHQQNIPLSEVAEHCGGRAICNQDLAILEQVNVCNGEEILGLDQCKLDVKLTVIVSKATNRAIVSVDISTRQTRWCGCGGCLWSLIRCEWNEDGGT